MAISQPIFGVEPPNFAGLLFFMSILNICSEKTDLEKKGLRFFFKVGVDQLWVVAKTPIGFFHIKILQKVALSPNSNIGVYFE